MNSLPPTSLYNPNLPSKPTSLGLWMFVLLSLLLAACAPQTAGMPSPAVTSTPTNQPQTVNPSPSPQPTTPTAMDKTIDQTTRPTPVLLDEPATPTPGTLNVGEVPPDLLNTLLLDLAERLGISSEEITILHTQTVEWSDGSLGCPQPGMMYIQVITPGYRVVLLANDQLFDYHTDTKAHFILCNPDGEIDEPPPLLPIKPGNNPPKCKFPPCR